MTNAEFIQATSRLENYYDKEYTTEQLKIMFDMLKEWNIQKYIRAINYCIRNNKFLPKVADLTSAESDNNQVVEKPKIDFIKCNKCSEGFVRYFKELQNGGKTIKYEYLALCTCENGHKQREINGYNFPSIAEIGL